MDWPKYRIEIFWSDEDGGYIANVPELPYCSAFGESYEEALHEVQEAMELHLETLREEGRPIPEPLLRPGGLGIGALPYWDLPPYPALPWLRRGEPPAPELEPWEVLAAQTQAFFDAFIEAQHEVFEEMLRQVPHPQEMSDVREHVRTDVREHVRKLLAAMYPRQQRGAGRSGKGSEASRS